MRTLQIYINDQFYKELTVPDMPDGSYNPVPALTSLIVDKNLGLLNQYLLDSEFSIRMQFKRIQQEPTPEPTPPPDEC